MQLTTNRTLPFFSAPLLLSLALAVVFCAHGITWGRVECWNPDMMALRPLIQLRPGNYFKPPFHTYLTHLIVVWPLQALLRAAHLRPEQWVNFNSIQLVAARCLTMALFLGTITLAYDLALRPFGSFAAAVVALSLATSAGFVAFAHFLTVDTPLLFWMLAAFWFAQRLFDRPTFSDYCAAGFLTGLATATKYNGLVVGTALVIAHILISRKSWKAIVDRRLLGGLAMVPFGFVTGCPTILVEPRTFWNDFLYNYTVAPRYAGQANQFGYVAFLRKVPEILGWPGTLIVTLLVITSSVLIIRRRALSDLGTRAFILTSCVCLIYFVKIGAFPRATTRFTLPAVPLMILMTAPALERLAARPWVVGVLGTVLVYNSLCSFLVGTRFNNDPRLDAQSWIIKNAAPGCVIEASPASPHWTKLPELHATEVDVRHPEWSSAAVSQTRELRMPIVSGRSELFRKIFPNNKLVLEYGTSRDRDASNAPFTAGELRLRNPDLITIDSHDFDSTDKVVHEYYPELLEGKLGYEVAFTGKTARPSWWIYPRHIDALQGWVVILKRNTRY